VIIETIRSQRIWGQKMVEIKVLGCYGSRLPGFNTTSFLLNGNVLVDAGTVASVLTIEEQVRIDHVLITHAHLDHVRDLMLLADNINIAARRNSPVAVASTAGIIRVIKKHLFNGVIWPDFSSIPTRENPVMVFEDLALEAKHDLGGLSVTPFTVSHTVETVGYLIGFDGGSVLFAGDTGPTERLWEIARREKNLLAIFIETSFHDSMIDMAARSGHLTPACLDTELKKLGDRAPDIYLFHMKPLYDLDLIRESVDRIRSRNIRILQDGDIIKLGR
jgi:ribonuclease BN (tRNA processing enzyme)